MIFKYDIHTTEGLIQLVEKATKEGKTYIKNTARQYGNRYIFQMEDDSVSDKMASVSIMDNGDQLELDLGEDLPTDLPKDFLEDNEKAKEEMDTELVEPFVKEEKEKPRKQRTKKTSK